MQELTDLTICKKIAEIENIGFSVVDNTDAPFVVSCVDHREYNPLADDALCFRLMVKYELIVGKAASGWSVYADLIANFIVNDNDPNRAICLAIIEANN